MRFFFIVIFFIATFSLRAQSAAEVYIARYDSLALEVLNKYGIPASIILGIALVESAAGTSKLCRVNHNHFGVKGRVKSKKTKSSPKVKKAKAKFVTIPASETGSSVEYDIESDGSEEEQEEQ